MVAPDQCYPVGVTHLNYEALDRWKTRSKSWDLEVRNLEGQEKEECLNTVEASVNKVPHEKVVGVWHISSNLGADHIFWGSKDFSDHLEEFSEIVKLSVDVAAHCHWRVHPLYVALLN